MTTEEFYAAVNQRLHEIRETRKRENGYSRSESEDYFKYLNEKGRANRANNNHKSN
jgi:hypothetical protein